MRDKLAEALVEREEKLRGARSTWENLWQSVCRYAQPNAATFTEKLPGGQERTRYILDSTAPRALELFASSLHTLLNNPSQRWIKISIVGKPGMADRPTVRQWFTDVEDLLLAALAGEQADIYSQLHTIYLGLGSVGTACLYVDVGRDGRLRCREYHMDDVVVAEGESEMIDTVFRRWKATVRQAKQRWPGLPIGKSVDDDSVGKKKKDDDEVEFIHVVVPATDPCAELFPKIKTLRNSGATFYGAWINKTDRVTVTTDIFYENPYLVPRWYKTRGEIYGRSPAMTALPDIRMVNQMSATILRGAEKIVDPPLYMPDGAVVSPVRLFPGGITYMEGSAEIKTLIPPGTSRIETGNQLLEQRQKAIEAAFFVPLMQTPESPVKTATQVLQEVDEKNRALSPMLVRVQSELFFGLVRRVYNLLDRAGRLPEQPAELAGEELTVEYVSPLVAAQRQMEGLSTIRLAEMMTPWAGVDRGIADWIDMDKMFNVVHMASGAPAKIAKTDAEVRKLRAAREEQVDGAQSAELALQGGEVLAKLTAANRPAGG